MAIRLTRSLPNRKNRVRDLDPRADSRRDRTNVLFCAFATNCQLTVEAAHNGGSVSVLPSLISHSV